MNGQVDLARHFAQPTPIHSCMPRPIINILEHEGVFDTHARVSTDLAPIAITAGNIDFPAVLLV